MNFFHDWHWHKREYIMAFSGLMSFIAIIYSIRSSNRTAQISLRAQLASSIDKYISRLPSNLISDTPDEYETYSVAKISDVYTIMMTFSQLVDVTELNNKSRQVVLESFWLQLPVFVWEEMAEGKAVNCINEPKIISDTLRSQRDTVYKKFGACIEKHSKKNTRPV